METQLICIQCGQAVSYYLCDNRRIRTLGQLLRFSTNLGNGAGSRYCGFAKEVLNCSYALQVVVCKWFSYTRSFSCIDKGRHTLGSRSAVGFCANRIKK
eukprot:14918499-Ditylum_brightwellii.AAC.1